MYATHLVKEGKIVPMKGASLSKSLLEIRYGMPTTHAFSERLPSKCRTAVFKLQPIPGSCS